MDAAHLPCAPVSRSVSHLAVVNSLGARLKVMPLTHRSRFIIALFLAGCICMFASCDRRLLVAGHVFDDRHRPLGHATVELDGVKKETDENGCFYFGDVSGGSDLNLRVAKVGYKPYRAGKEFGSYIIVVTLASDDGEQQSSATWHKTLVGEISKYQECSEQ